MAQVTIYMDAETEARTRAAARAAGVSVSAWLAALARQRTRSQWPPEVLELAGAWADLPTAEELRSAQGTDVRREAM